MEELTWTYDPAEKRIITKDIIVYCVAGEAYRLAPRNRPRKIDKIMEKVNIWLESTLEQPLSFAKDYYSSDMTEAELQKFMREMLMDIYEFKELNLTQEEFEKGTSAEEVADKIVFTSGFEKRDEDSWRHDFIDLDAFIQNVCRCIWRRCID